MDNTLISSTFSNWQRKLMALISAIIIWLFVNSSITETKTIPNVPIRITNLPPDKTIVGLLPNRLLSKRVTLTLSGTKDIIHELEPGDLEVLLDVSTAPSDEWVVKINKKNLVSLDPSIDLAHNITQVEYSEFVLKLSPLSSAKVPITIKSPIGEPPEGYEFLDIWPQKLVQTLSGSEEEIQSIKDKGLELTFNLSEITKADLESIKTQPSLHDDEVSFLVPDKWKQIGIPFHNHTLEEINDPDAHSMRIDFLRIETLPIGRELPIRVFYPLKYSDKINPQTYPLATNDLVINRNDITILNMPLYVRNVSKLFLEIVSDNLEVEIVAAPQNERESLQWSMQVIDPIELEDMYIAYLLVNAPHEAHYNKGREALLRKRFQTYLKNLSLYSNPEKRLHLDARLTQNSIQVHATP